MVYKTEEEFPQHCSMYIIFWRGTRFCGLSVVARPCLFAKKRAHSAIRNDNITLTTSIISRLICPGKDYLRAQHPLKQGKIALHNLTSNLFT